MIFTSPRPSVDVPDTSVTSFVLQRAELYAARIAVVDVTGETGYTFGELATAVRRTAAGLRARGFGKGDVLAVLAPNVPEYPIVFHAAALAGGTVVLLNPLDLADDLVSHLTEAGARLLVTVPGEVAKVTALITRTKVEEVFVLGEADGATPFAALATHEPAGDGAAQPAVDPARDVVALLHSSGSTGHPKGVMLTHRNLIANHQITRLYIVPTIAVLLAKSPLVDRYDLSSLRSIVSGGAMLDPEIARQVRQRLGCHISQGYGLTEAMVSFMQAEDPVTPGSVGSNAPNVECRIVDITTGGALGRNQRGEILVRGPHVMKGYLNDEEATRKVLEPDGFLHTGDLGYVDDDGELFIVDRIKELIKYKGQQVSPVELEAVLITHPKVADAAVIGVPDEEASEVPKGFVVAKEPITAEELMAFVAERVAPYKKIRQIEFIDQIPRTPVGKIERRSLKEREPAAR